MSLAWHSGGDMTMRVRSAGRRLLWAVLLAGWVGGASAQVFAHTGEDGSVTLTNLGDCRAACAMLVSPAPAAPAARGPEAPARQDAPPATVTARSSAAPRLPSELRELIAEVARGQQIDAALLAAVAATESGFNARAVSPKGAAGLMQLMPDTARRFQVADRFDVRQSLAGGAAYLRWLQARFAGDLTRMLAAYNAGEQAVARAGGVPAYAETQAYVPKVLAHLKHYQRVF